MAPGTHATSAHAGYRRRTASTSAGHVSRFVYLEPNLNGWPEAPPADANLRAELEQLSAETLLQELRERDPVAFEKIDRQNPRRVIRAVEVIRLTGKKFSDQRAEWKSEAGTEASSQNSEARIFCLTRPARELHQRINQRVDEMFSQGLVEETRRLLNQGLAQNKFALQAIGYRQVVEHLRGERDLAETMELVKIRTRQFAKRQLTWFRRHGRCEWLELMPDEPVENIVEKLKLTFPT